MTHRRCQRCGAAADVRREINWSVQLKVWVCLGCYLRGTERRR